MSQKNWVLAAVCFTFLSGYRIKAAFAEAAQDCSSILMTGGLTSEQLQEKAAKMIDKNEPNGPQFFANPQGELNANKLGPIAQTVYANMGKYLIGHDDMKRAFALAVQSAALGTKDPKRPAGVFLLGGITGTGKSESPLALAQAIGLNKDDVTTIDCGEMQQGHMTTRLLGAPPSYIGHGDATLITQEVLDSRTSPVYKVNIVLVDELEKAHDDLKRLLLGALEKGKMTLSGKDNPTLDFSHTIFVMTTNLGQGQMQDILHSQNKFIGFVPTSVEEKLDQDLTGVTLSAISDGLSPEFRNRIEDTFVFLPTTRSDAEQILNMRLAAAQRESFFANENENARILFNVTPQARAYLLDKGFDPTMGGRSIRRLVEKLITKPLENLIGSGDLKAGDVVDVKVSDDGQRLTFHRVLHGWTWEKQIELYKEFYGPNIPAPEMPKDPNEADDTYAVSQKALGPAKNTPRNDGQLNGDGFDNLIYDFSEVRNQAHYKMFLQNLNEANDCIKLAKMASYSRTAPYYSDQVLSDFLERMPKVVPHCGYKNSEVTIELMRRDGAELRSADSSLTLEPYYLTIVTYGMRRLTFIRDSNKKALYGMLASALTESGKYLAHLQAKVGPAYQTPNYVVRYFEYLMSRTIALPPTPPPGSNT